MGDVNKRPNIPFTPLEGVIRSHLKKCLRLATLSPAAPLSNIILTRYQVVSFRLKPLPGAPAH